MEHTAAQGMILYSHVDDFRSHWVRLVLAEKQIKHQVVWVDHDDEDLASLNPYNQLPMLLDQSSKLFEVSIICEYLDDRYRQNKLYADSPIARAEQRQFIWRIQQDWLRLAQQILQHPDSLDAQQQTQSRQELRGYLVSLNPLFQHYPYFLSDHFSILDCLLATIFLRLEHMQITLPTQHCRAMVLYQQRIFSRPHFQQSLSAQEQRRYPVLR